MGLYNLEWLENNPAHILFKCISGSHAYGTNTPTSDTDIRGVFILPKEAILSNKYIEQINDDDNDIVYYEIRRFLELLATQNPTVLELLNAPEDCIQIKHPIFDEVLKNKNTFITKNCKNSFAGYAIAQIQKARGLNKKQNWEQSKIERKTVLDFCYVPDKQGSIPVKEWLSQRGLNQEDCGLSNIPHMKYTYGLYHSITGSYKGIVSNEQTANDVCLSSINKGENPLTIIQFNKDGYSVHCSDFKSYQTWLKERNEQRYVDVKTHGQKIDGKNMLHVRRLLDMAKEIAEGKGINVRRENAKDLLAIRKGEVDLKTLLDHAESEVKEVDRLFLESSLPDKVEPEFISNLLLFIRQEYYK